MQEAFAMYMIFASLHGWTQRCLIFMLQWYLTKQLSIDEFTQVDQSVHKTIIGRNPFMTHLLVPVFWYK